MGQSSRNRAEIPLWAMGMQLRGPDIADVTLLAVSRCWVQHPVPHHRRMPRQQVGRRLGHREVAALGAALAFPDPLGEWCGMPRLSVPCQPAPCLSWRDLSSLQRGISGLLCLGPDCFRLKEMNRVLLLSGLHFALPPAVVSSPRQGRIDLSNAQASSTFFLTVLCP